MLKTGDRDRITCQSRSVVHAILSRKEGQRLAIASGLAGLRHSTSYDRIREHTRV